MAFKMNGFNPGKGTGIDKAVKLTHEPKSGYVDLKNGNRMRLHEIEDHVKANKEISEGKNNKRRLKEVKSSIRDLRIERLKKIGNKRAQDNLKSAIAGLKQKKKELKNK